MTATATSPGRAKTPPARSEVDPRHCWDLSSLYREEAAWEREFEAVRAAIPRFAAFRGRLGESAQALREMLDQDTETDRQLDRLHNYAGRKSDEDTGNSHFKGLADRVIGLVTEFQEATAWVRPELMAIPDARMRELLTDPALEPYRFAMEKILRHKPYTLSEREERLLALSTDLAKAPYEAFGQLNNADLKFGTITDEQGESVEVTHGGYLSFLTRRDRAVRQRFFEAYYRQYEAHKHTLAATLAAGVKRNLFYAKSRGYKTARESALFGNHVPEAVYDNLVSAVRANLGPLHRYYDLRRRALGLDEIHFYDIFVPIVAQVESQHSYEEAVELITAGLAPLGESYVSRLRAGLAGGWVDRYENRGKRSGAYSAGCYDSEPYILMNFRDDAIESVYTLAHEAGHSMHSLHSNRGQPPQYAGYSIFVAEVASTFNEELLTAHLLATTDDPRTKAYIINREIDDIRGTLFRQTMFAEFEQSVHARAEERKPLTLDDLTGLYHEILARYYGPGFVLDPQLDLECLRIPHFYYNFYVFQYSTGISAAIALSRRVLARERGALERYVKFLSSGGSRYPIDLLREAGVDMTRPEPVDAALAHFDRLVGELEALLRQIGQLK